jgi:hypothetical protein
MKHLLIVLMALAGSIYAGPGLAATCSCAGVPLLFSIDTSASEQGQFYLNYSSEVHEINDLVSGSDDVRDETGRERRSISQVISGSYAITDRWSVSGLVSYVEHNRKIGSSFLGASRSSGLGDSVLLVRYTPFFITPFSRQELALGIGVRMPTGEDAARQGFITLSEDMQPSVGAIGEILWSSYSYAFNQAATMQFNASANYTFNRENSRDYVFGDEFNLALGFSQSIGTKFSYSTAMRYRTTRGDQRQGFTIPNTGGKWLDFVPAVAYSVTDNLNVALSGRIPIERELKGALQFTTSYSYSLSFTYGF